MVGLVEEINGNKLSLPVLPFVSHASSPWAMPSLHGPSLHDYCFNNILIFLIIKQFQSHPPFA